MLTRLAIFIAGVLAVALVSGCGDSEEEAPTKAAFVKEASEICKANRARDLADAEKLFIRAQQNGEPVQKTSVTAVETLVVPRLRAQTEEIRDLTPPAGDEEQIEAILDAVDEVLDKADEDPARYLQLVGAYKRPFQEAHQMAKAYGIQECARA